MVTVVARNLPVVLTTPLSPPSPLWEQGSVTLTCTLSSSLRGVASPGRPRTHAALSLSPVATRLHCTALTSHHPAAGSHLQALRLG